MRVVKGLVHVASNAVLDVLVRDAEMSAEPARDGWGANVQMLQQPVEMALGGCGAAPAYILGKLGQHVALTTNWAPDSAGELVQGWLRQAGVTVAPATARATAVHVILLSREGQRRSFYYGGEKVVWEQALNSEVPEWFLAAGYGLVDAGDLEELSRVFAQCRRQGAQIAFDPGPWFAGRVSVAAMTALYSHVDCLIGTADELCQWHPGAEPRRLAEHFAAQGPRWVVVKCGGAGAAYAGVREGSDHLPTQSVARGNTVGAGDAFNGRLIYGLCQGEGIREAVQQALQLATRAVRQGRGVLGAFD